MRRKQFGLVSAGALLIAIGAGASIARAAPAGQPAAAAPAESKSGLGEVVITAEHRSQNLQRAAVAVTAVAGDQLTKRDIVNIDQLSQVVPAMQATQGTGPYTNVIIRGITTTVANLFGDPSVALRP